VHNQSSSRANIYIISVGSLIRIKHVKISHYYNFVRVCRQTANGSRHSGARWRCRVGGKISRLESVFFDVASAPTTCRQTTSGSVPAMSTRPTRLGSTSTCPAVSEAAPDRHRALRARRPSRPLDTARSLAGCSRQLLAATVQRTTRTAVRRCWSSTNRTWTGQLYRIV